MDVILRKDIERLGKAGTRLKVKDGYARNYLLPRNLAFLASESNLKKVQDEMNRVQIRKEKEIINLREIAAKLEGVSCTVIAHAIDEKKIYGSIDKEAIKSAMEAEGFKIEAKSIVLDEPIKELGVYDIAVNFQPDISAKIKVWVVKK
jgi:large subunit ribosomal protein L9